MWRLSWTFRGACALVVGLSFVPLAERESGRERAGPSIGQVERPDRVEGPDHVRRPRAQQDAGHELSDHAQRTKWNLQACLRANVGEKRERDGRESAYTGRHDEYRTPVEEGDESADRRTDQHARHHGRLHDPERAPALAGWRDMCNQ